VVKRGVPEEQVERYVETLGEIGAVYDLRPTPIAPVQVIAVGSASAGAGDRESRADDGATLMLPQPREQAAPPPRFAGTVLQAVADAPDLASWAEPSRGLGTADTVRERADVMIAGTGVWAEPSGSSGSNASSSSTWLEGRASEPLRGDPNDTLVESHPAGSLVNPSAPPAALPPMPPLPMPFSPQAPFSRSAPAAVPGAFGGDLEQRAPDSRLMQVHAPTVRSFQTLPEGPAPVLAPPASVEPVRTENPWGEAPFVAAVQAPAVIARGKEWTQPQGSPTGRGSEPAPAPPLSQPSQPALAPFEPLAFEADSPPLSLAPLAPAPQSAAVQSAGPQSRAPLSPAGPPLADVWRGIEPVSAAELGPRRPRSSQPAPLEQAEPEPAADLQLYGRGQRAASDPPAGRASNRPPRGQSPAVVKPGVWEGSLRGSQRPPAGAASNGLPLPPGSLQAALKAGPRPSVRVAPLRVAEPAVELPAWLRWTLRVGLGVALFVIIGALRQCRALDSDVEKALARWESRPSLGAGEGTHVTPGAATSRDALGPIALDWMRSDMNQFTNGDKDRVRGLAQRFKEAGAVEVYVGTISDAGMIKVAGELLVVMPTDPTRRAAVVAVHEGFLRATFGAFAPRSDATVDVLRVTL
jgi:hypothetical protein